jgi:O-antigen/teichoic acid export membrane protein
MLGETVKTASRGYRVMRNVLWSGAGAVVPALLGIGLMPSLIQGLGTEAFGMLALAWVITGIFGLLDFGLGRATTRLIAIGLARGEQIMVGETFWSAITLILVVGLLSAAGIAALAPALGRHALTLRPDAETLFVAVLRLFALSLPAFVITGVIRSAFEGAERLDLSSAVQALGNSLNYLIPAAIVWRGGNVEAVVVGLVAARILATPIYLGVVLRVVPQLRSGRVGSASLWSLVSMGRWFMISNVVGLLLAYLDRLLLASFSGLRSVAIYTPPYELVTRLTMIPTSVMTALFPTLSSRAFTDTGASLRLYDRSVKLLLLVMIPICLTLFLLGGRILTAWVGAEIAEAVAGVTQVLSLGLLALSLGGGAFNFLQASGRADLVARVHLIELPLYLVAAPIMIQRLGVLGAAMAWSLRTTGDALLLMGTVKRLYSTDRTIGTGRLMKARPALALWAGTAAFLTALEMIDVAASVRVGLYAAFLPMYASVAWRYVLDEHERSETVRALRVRL